MSIDLSKFKLEAEKAVLVVLDIQESLVPAMPQGVYLRMRESVTILLNAS